MTALVDAIAAASSADLRRAVVLLHVAGQRQRALIPRYLEPLIVEPGQPMLLAAVCVDLTAELVRRGDATGPCPICAAALAARAA